MNELNESLKVSLSSLERYLPQIDHAMAIASEKIRQVDEFQLLWRASLRETL